MYLSEKKVHKCICVKEGTNCGPNIFLFTKPKYHAHFHFSMRKWPKTLPTFTAKYKCVVEILVKGWGFWPFSLFPFILAQNNQTIWPKSTINNENYIQLFNVTKHITFFSDTNFSISVIAIKSRFQWIMNCKQMALQWHKFCPNRLCIFQRMWCFWHGWF